MLELISILALIFLSLFGYSAGTVSGSQKRGGIEPGIIDFLLIVIILAAAFILGSIFDINRWLWVVITALLSGCIGVLRALLNGNVPAHQSYEQPDNQPAKKSLWSRWSVFRHWSAHFRQELSSLSYT